MVDVREKIANLIANGPWHEGPDEAEALACADGILALPEIAEALRFVEGAPGFGDRRYTGPIEPGMVFIWECDKPHAWARVEVVEVGERFGEPAVKARVLAGKGTVGEDYWNDEDRFREAAEPEPKAKSLLGHSISTNPPA